MGLQTSRAAPGPTPRPPDLSCIGLAPLVLCSDAGLAGVAGRRMPCAACAMGLSPTASQGPASDCSTEAASSPGGTPRAAASGLAFRAAGCTATPKASGLGEDAFFAARHSLGVADGVGGLRQFAHFGVDVAAYARELMRLAEGALQEGASCCGALSRAERAARCYGASTATLVKAGADAATITAASLGDSGFVVLRPIGGGKFSIIARSVEQQHHWNFPYQLARLPRELEESVPEDAPQTSARDAEQYVVEVLRGDLVLLFTDGFSDNVYDSELLDSVLSVSRLARRGEGKSTRASGADVVAPEAIAEALVELALRKSRSRRSRTPFADAASQQGHFFIGGKEDDVTVVAAWVHSLS